MGGSFKVTQAKEKDILTHGLIWYILNLYINHIKQYDLFRSKNTK